MKKSIALLLAALMLLGALAACGAPAEAPAAAETPAPAAEAPAAPEAPAAAETPAAPEAPAAAETPAPAAAETPAPAAAEAPAANGLRAGESVTVTSAEELRDAYQKVYEGTVNEIKLGGNVDITKKELVGKEEIFPVFSSVTYLIIHMPEGTQLDLNGFKLTARGLNGLDTTKDNSMGKIVDSFGGGSITLYTWGKTKIFNTTLRVAKLYPEFVRQISITSAVEDSADYDFIIPENVCLSLNNESSSLVANSITFKPGATLKVGEKAKVGVTGTKRIIFECKGEADHSRQGIEFATEVKDVQ